MDLTKEEINYLFEKFECKYKKINKTYTIRELLLAFYNHFFMGKKIKGDF